MSRDIISLSPHLPIFVLIDWPNFFMDATTIAKSRINGLLPKSISCFDKLSMNGKVTWFQHIPFALSLSKGKRLVWATARKDLTPLRFRTGYCDLVGEWVICDRDMNLYEKSKSLMKIYFLTRQGSRMLRREQWSDFDSENTWLNPILFS